MACSGSGTARDPALIVRWMRSSMPIRPAHRETAACSRWPATIMAANPPPSPTSEQVFAAALMPVLNPATLQDYLDLGLYGFALSRFSGCWVGFKAISETVESSASIYSDPSRVSVVLPSDFELPPGGLNIRWLDPPLEHKRRLHGPKMAAVAAFARANQLDRVVVEGKPAGFCITATGKAYLDLRQAPAALGSSEREAEARGM